MGEPGFWDDQESAARISTEHARITRRLDRYERLRHDYDDARELFALDGEVEDEIARSLAPLQRELDRLEEDALFTGEYDAGDAVVTIHSGTGGTDAQDWAEMLLRMYQRWASDRGFQIELLEASPGEEAGLKSATFTVKGESAYGILKAERGAAQDIGFGSQIRSYVLHPYQLVKDHRTDHEAGNAQGVLDGALDGFIRAYLLQAAGNGG